MSILRLLFCGGLLGATLVSAETPPATNPVPAMTPAQWLKSQPKPAFRAGHTLPRLTRYGWECLPLVTGKPLAEDWGYALEFTRYVTTLEAVAQIDVHGSREAQTVALALANPQVYKLNVGTTQTIPSDKTPPGAYTRDAAGNILSGQGVSADGTTWGGAGPLISLEAPDALWVAAGDLRAAPLRALVARGIPIDSIHNGGESGLGIPGFAEAVWNKDPVIGAAIGASPWGQGSMYNHASARKANSELIMAKITKAAVPGRSFFNYYCAGGGVNRNQDWAVDAWSGRWEHTRGINDLPSSEIYYPTARFTGRLDALTRVLNAVSLEIATGDTLSYNWISGGWDGDVADNARWTGFLKCYYTAGMIGANTGKYGSFVQGSYEAPFPQNAPPIWLTQLIATSYVHALFSQLEDLVRSGDLLPGPARHSVSPDEPAYEFPTGDDTARVLVRKRRGQATWLITAWAADGADRIVPIYVPELGQINVEARVVGSVYTATLSNGNVTLIRHDNEGATYSAVALGTPVVTPVNLTIPLPANDRLLWLAADCGVTADAAGKVSAWASQGGTVKVTQPDAACQPTLVADAVRGKPAIRFANTWLANMDLGAQGDAFIGPLTVYAVFADANAASSGKTVVMAVVPNGNPWAGGQGFAIANNIAEHTQMSQGVALKTAPYVSAATRLQKLIVGENDQPGSSFCFTGDIAEILVYKGQSPLNQERVRLYLENKYGISRNSALVNGDFEQPVVKGGFQYAPGPGATRSRGAQGWLFANLAALQANGSGWSDAAAPSGKQTAVLQGADDRLGRISQMVHLSAGTYALRFKAARRSGQSQPVKASVDQIQIGALITPGGHSFADYTTSSFTVKEGLHLIRLEATDGTGDKSVFIDDVTLDVPDR